MLKATTDEQRRHIEEILAPHHIYISWPLDFEKENDWGYDERVDAYTLMATSPLTRSRKS